MVELRAATRQAIDDSLGARRQLIDDLAAGRVDLARVLAGRTDAGRRDVRVLAVLDSLDGVGKVPVRRGLAKLSIAESTPLGELTASEVDALVGEFG